MAVNRKRGKGVMAIIEAGGLALAMGVTAWQIVKWRAALKEQKVQERTRFLSMQKVENPAEWAIVEAKTSEGKKAKNLLPKTKNAIARMAREAFNKKPNERLTAEELANSAMAIYHHVKASPEDTEVEIRALATRLNTLVNDPKAFAQQERRILLTERFNDYRDKAQPAEKNAIQEFLQP